MLIWCLTNISYYQCWKQLCCFIFLWKLWYIFIYRKLKRIYLKFWLLTDVFCNMFFFVCLYCHCQFNASFLNNVLILATKILLITIIIHYITFILYIYIFVLHTHTVTYKGTKQAIIIIIIIYIINIILIYIYDIIIIIIILATYTVYTVCRVNSLTNCWRKQLYSIKSGEHHDVI